jgi:hypothetical protein
MKRTNFSLIVEPKRLAPPQIHDPESLSPKIPPH